MCHTLNFPMFLIYLHQTFVVCLGEIVTPSWTNKACEEHLCHCLYVRNITTFAYILVLNYFYRYAS